jgi:hypothetical protein
MPQIILAAAIDFTGVTLPFEVGDLITSAMALAKTFAPYLLLAIAIGYTPKIFNIAKTALAARNSKNN